MGKETGGLRASRIDIGVQGFLLVGKSIKAILSRLNRERAKVFQTFRNEVGDDDCQEQIRERLLLSWYGTMRMIRVVTSRIGKYLASEWVETRQGATARM